MATLDLVKMWINLLSTGEGIAAPTLGPSSTSGLAGEVRTYAGGRQRFVGREGIAGSLSRTLRLLTLTQVQQLESWRGQTVLVRDTLGESWWGVFKEVTRTSVKGSGKFDAAITVELVTQDDGV